MRGRLDLANTRFRFTIGQLLVLTLAIAGLSALLTSFGPHFFWASKHVIVEGFPAMRKVDSQSTAADCELSTCTFNGLSFGVPTSMIGSARIGRFSPTNVWLIFEDSTRRMQINIAPPDLRHAMAREPFELQDRSTPQLLEIAISTASEDFSFNMSKSELRIHDWVMETRGLLNLDAQNMDRYSRISQRDFDAILVSADPASIDANRRLRSIFVWESTDRRRFGTIWFGDSRNVDVGWIDAVAESMSIVSEDQLTTSELVAFSDAEILARLHSTEHKTRK